MTAVWVVGAALATMWTVGPLAYFLGHRLGLHKGHDEREELAREWRILFDELGAEHGRAINKLEATIDILHRNIDTSWQAGIMQGQILQAEREAEGL